MKTDHLKFVRGSKEDRLSVGYCSDLFIGGVCHGNDECKVFADLCRLVGDDLQQREAVPKPN